MKLAEYLRQAQQLKHQDRTAAIAFLEQSLHVSLSENTEVATSITTRILLDLAGELICTKQPQLLQKAEILIQQAEDRLNQSLDVNQEEIAYLLYAKALMTLTLREFGEIREVLPTLEIAYEAYGNLIEGQTQTDDLFGQYYLQINDFPSALNHFERSLSLRLESENECAIAQSYIHLGQFYLVSGDINQAESLFQNALDIAITNSHQLLQLQAIKGLAKVAIAQAQWQSAISLIKDTISLLQEPIDTIELGYLYCDIAEALLGDRQIEESLICIRMQVLPRFRDYEYTRGIAIAKHLRGRIYIHRLQEGLDTLDEDAIETAEDSLLDASMTFEQFGMMVNYAKCLYDLACLYQLCNSSHLQYQYQGKSLRSLELSLSVLDQLGLSNTQLASQVEKMLNQAMHGRF